MADIFISYSRKDRAIVAPLAAFLEGHGFDVWWDTHITGGAEFRREIERQLAAASAVVVVWSANSTASNFVIDESNVALQAHKLVPVRVHGFSADDIPLGFREIQSKPIEDRDALLRALAAKGVAPSKGAAPSGLTVPIDTTEGRSWMWGSTYASIRNEVPSVHAYALSSAEIVCKVRSDKELGHDAAHPGRSLA